MQGVEKGTASLVGAQGVSLAAGTGSRGSFDDGILGCTNVQSITLDIYHFSVPINIEIINKLNNIFYDKINLASTI